MNSQPVQSIANLMREVREKPTWAGSYTPIEFDTVIAVSISQRGTVYGRTHALKPLLEIARRYLDTRNL